MKAKYKKFLDRLSGYDLEEETESIDPPPVYSSRERKKAKPKRRVGKKSISDTVLVLHERYIRCTFQPEICGIYVPTVYLSMKDLEHFILGDSSQRRI
jgi:hypothetical protein